MAWGQRRRTLSAEEIAANKAKREARDLAARTCQVCARPICANTGLIAHHGYTRPGWGNQTASCYGARRLPFEADRETLGEVILMVAGWLKDRRESVRKHKAESCDVVEFQIWETREPGTGWNGPKTKHYHTFKFNRAAFEAYRADPANAEAFRRAFSGSRAAWTFDQWKAATIADLEREAKGFESDLKEMRKRFDGWRKVEAWDAEAQTWRKV